MTTWRRLTVIAALMATSSGVGAQARVTKPDTVLFVCEHGTVRSLLAMVFFQQYAAEAGLPFAAVSRGTRADSVVPPWMSRGLAADGIALGAWRPRTLSAGDLAAATLVVSFDVPSQATAGTHGARLQWDGLPSVSQDYARGRDAVRMRVRLLVDSLKRTRASKRTPAP